MDCPEDILLVRVLKFKDNLEKQHGNLSTSFSNTFDRIGEYLAKFEVGEETIDQTYEIIYASEKETDIKRVENSFKSFVEKFWE